MGKNQEPQRSRFKSPSLELIFVAIIFVVPLNFLCQLLPVLFPV